MSNKPRDWPNVAKRARDESAEAAAEIDRMVKPLLYKERIFTEAELMQKYSIIDRCAQLIMRLMEGQGAQTRP